MLSRRSAQGLALALAIWPTPGLAQLTPSPPATVQVSYGCDEVVAIGRVETVGYVDLTQPGEPLGRGRYDMQLTIKYLLRGQEHRRVVPVSGDAHGQMRNDADFWLVLTPTPDGGYVLRTANLRRLPYRVA